MNPRSYSKVIDDRVRIYLQIKFLLEKQERIRKKIKVLTKELKSYTIRKDIRGAKK